MEREAKETNNGQPRVLLFSQRNIYEPSVWRCSFREFERILQEVDSVEVLAPKPTKWSPYRERVAMRAGEFVGFPINPGIPTIKVEREYDVFITVCEKMVDLLQLTSLKGLRDKCKTTVCWVFEFWVNRIPLYKSCLKILSQFDYVIFSFVNNEPLKAIIKGQGQYLPGGIDTLRFCPYPNPPARSIDVLSVGRRAPAMHKALLQMASEEGKLYVHDTIKGLEAYDLEEHRLLMANLAKRSRYFIVSPGKFDKPEETGGQSEFGFRYFEAAAPGAIMIGMRPPNNREFDKIFDWEDAVIEVPFTSGEIVSVIRDLDKEPERQMKVRQTNMTQCLLKHDWVYRWEAVLRLAGVQPLPALERRKQALTSLAATVEEDFFQRQKAGRA